MNDGLWSEHMIDSIVASFDRRVREEIHRLGGNLLWRPWAYTDLRLSHSRCRGASNSVSYQLWTDLFQYLGYSRTREVWWAAGWVLYPRYEKAKL